MTDKVLAVISFVALIAFIGVVVVYVKEIDLGLIVILCLLIGIYDFWTTLRNQNGNDNSNRGG